MQSALECPICMENYDPIERKPMLFPCGNDHTTCYVCIQDMHNKGKITCPFCNLEQKIPLKKMPVDKKLLA